MNVLTVLIKVGEKVRDINPADFITQDTVQEVLKLVKEVILP